MVNVLHRREVELETEADAYEFLERLRWGDDGPTECPHCASVKGAWFLTPKDPGGRKSKGGSSARSQRRVWKCRENSCRRQFSVLTNTVMHATKMPVRAWIGTVFDLCSNPKGVSARDIANQWGVTPKSAYAMLTRIQDALANPDVGALWFELKPAERAAIAQAEQLQTEAEKRDAETAEQAARAATERIEQDSKRALLEATNTRRATTPAAANGVATPRPIQAAAAATTNPTASDEGVERAGGGRVLGSDEAAEQAMSESTTTPIRTKKRRSSPAEIDLRTSSTDGPSGRKPASKAAGSAPDSADKSASREPSSGPASDAPTSRKRREPIGNEAPNAGADRARRAEKVRNKKARRRARSAADADGNRSAKRLSTAAEREDRAMPAGVDRELKQRPNAAAAEASDRTDRTDGRGSRSAESRSRKRDRDGRARNSQPVENSQDRSSKPRPAASPSEPANSSRAQDRSDRKRPKRDLESLPDSLGTGWLDAPDFRAPESDRARSEPDAAATPNPSLSLGPEWARSPGEDDEPMPPKRDGSGGTSDGAGMGE